MTKVKSKETLPTPLMDELLVLRKRFIYSKRGDYPNICLYPYGKQFNQLRVEADRFIHYDTIEIKGDKIVFMGMEVIPVDGPIRVGYVEESK